MLIYVYCFLCFFIWGVVFFIFWLFINYEISELFGEDIGDIEFEYSKDEDEYEDSFIDDDIEGFFLLSFFDGEGMFFFLFFISYIFI